MNAWVFRMFRRIKQIFRSNSLNELIVNLLGKQRGIYRGTGPFLVFDLSGWKDRERKSGSYMMMVIVCGP